ncbi:MAG: hypothetical protein EA349_11340 [Halomonadaceae bacterium]|nr:MAG: hypothetical protein EA349_11340 [Halomonadaceae bacterium]
MAVPMDSPLSGTQQARLLRERFGLAVDPFANGTSFFFTGGQRQHHLDSLRHLAAFGDMALLVSGEEGAGRSRLLQQLAQGEHQRLVVHELPAAAIQQPARLASVLGRLSGQPLAEMTAEAASSAFFAWSADQPRRWLLLLDNADNVPADVLAALLKGRTEQGEDSARAAVLLMAGSTALAAQLGEFSGAELLDGLYEIRLKPLDQDDIRHYLQSAFDRVGGDASSAITPRVLSRLEQESGGCLGRLRQLAPLVLLGLTDPAAPSLPEAGDVGSVPPVKQSPSLSMPSLARLRLWAGLALGLLGLSFLLVSLFYDGSDSDSAPALITEDVEFNELDRVRQAMGEDSPSVQSPPEMDLVQPEPGEALVERSDPLFAPQTVTPPVTAPVEQAPVTAQSEPGVEPESAPSPAESSPESFSPGLPVYFRDQVWIDSRESGNYTIQLLGSFNESTAIQFVRNNAVDGMVYVRSSHQGEPWFVVIVGDYGGRDAARTALRQGLPAALREGNPWVRPFAGL